MEFTRTLTITFLEKMFCRENPMVDSRAETNPIISKEISVTVAMATPRNMGIRLK